MKKFLLFIAFTLSTFTGFSQSNYQTNTNRVILSTVVNSDTIIVENLENRVRINGELDLLEVEYHNLDARSVVASEQPEERADFRIKFWNEYSWLDERIKTTEATTQFTDEIYVNVKGEEQVVPATFVITRIRGGQGFSVMIEVRGKFNMDDMEDVFPKFKFESDLYFAIYLNVQVIS